MKSPRLLVVPVVLIGMALLLSGCADRRTAAVQIMVAGKVVNSDRSEWLNDRLVVFFLKGKEVGRATSTLQKVPPRGITWTGSPASSNGNEDGIFYVQASNPYGVTTEQLARDMGQVFTPGMMLLNKDYLVAYTWVGDLDEGSSLELPLPSKNTKYVLRVLEGEVASLPKEILQPGSLQLRPDNTIALSSPITATAEIQALASSAAVSSMNYNPQTVREMNRITVPIDNCSGTLAVHQKYTQTQAFVKQVTTEVSARLGAEVPLGAWLRVLGEIETKYGFEQGQIDARSVEYEMGAEPRSKVVYVVTWQEIWDSGTAELTVDRQSFSIPFDARTDLVYRIDSSSKPCP